MSNWNFSNPLWLYGLLAIPIAAVIMGILRSKRMNHYAYSQIEGTGQYWFAALKNYTGILSWMAVGSICIALARPQTSQVIQQPSQNLGIDMMLALDISASMLAKDLKPNRLEALKEVATDFVIRRNMDRIGLVIYAGESYSPVPLTTDHSLLNEQIRSLEYDMLDGGTAIGMGLSTAANRLAESTAKSKIIILLTDGENNVGLVDPIQAGELCASLGIKVYTIGLGSNGIASMPVGINPNTKEFIYRPVQVTIDEELLKRIADMTSGQYFRATDRESLENIYDVIDGLEKSEIEGFQFYRYDEHYSIFVCIAIALIACELLLNFIILKSAF
jgi:Ca-activated chloride channel homolog|tara:strand:- start:913 stop:1908 length:996 start_codon:yes stop_codon:yes gene_type:complete